MKLGLLMRNPPSCCLPVGRSHQIVTCPKSFWSGDRLSDSPNCGRFLSHCSVVLSPLLTPSFMLEKYFQADWRSVCWPCWKEADAVSVFAVVSLVWLQYFRFFCLYPATCFGAVSPTCILNFCCTRKKFQNYSLIVLQQPWKIVSWGFPEKPVQELKSSAQGHRDQWLPAQHLARDSPWCCFQARPLETKIGVDTK